MPYDSLRILVAVLTLVCSAPAYAATPVVDQDGQASATSCSAATVAFTTITAAVTASANGDIIVVCPGTGPCNEQLSITKALPSPMIANSTSAYSGSPSAAAILVADTTAILTNLVVDGADGNVSGVSCSGPNMIRIFFRNASGTSTVTVSGVNVHTHQKNGIVGNGVGTTIDVVNSLVTGEPSANVSVQNGVQIGFGATGSIVGTRIVDMMYPACTFPYTPGSGCDTGSSLGVLVFDADVDVVVQDNVMTKTQGGIFIGGGIIANGSNRTDVSGNVNRVNTNRIQDAPAGVWVYSGTDNVVNVTGPRTNTFFNVETPTILPVALTSAARSSSTTRGNGKARGRAPHVKAERY